MEFAILTTTYNRPKELLRAIESVEKQVYSNVRHFIVNDSPECDYSSIEKYIELKSVWYLKNETNIGKNKSLNKILQHLGEIQFNGYIIFLDDDDWLSPSCCSDFKTKIEETGESWLVSNRAYENGKSLTTNRTKKMKVHYTWDYLITHGFSGDATHCIKITLGAKARFPESIKNGEEWVYFTEIAHTNKFFRYFDKNGTITNGYNDNGVTNNYQHPDTNVIIYEIWQRKITNLLIVVYLLLRVLKRHYQKLCRKYQ